MLLVLNFSLQAEEDYELLDEFISRDLINTNFPKFNELLSYIKGNKTSHDSIPDLLDEDTLDDVQMPLDENILGDIDNTPPYTNFVLGQTFKVPRQVKYAKLGFKPNKFSSLRREKQVFGETKETKKNKTTADVKRQLGFAERSTLDIKRVRHKSNRVKQGLKKKVRVTNRKGLLNNARLLKATKLKKRRLQSVSTSFLNSFQRFFFSKNNKLVVNFSSQINWVFIFFSLSTI